LILREALGPLIIVKSEGGGGVRKEGVRGSDPPKP